MPLPQKTNRNKAVIALHLCGFNHREIGELLGSDRRNIQLFCRKYMPRYFEEIINRLIKKLTSMVLKPTKLKKENK